MNITGEKIKSWIHIVLILGGMAVVFVGLNSGNQQSIQQSSDNEKRLIDSRHVQNDFRNTSDEKLDNLTAKVDTMSAEIADLKSTLTLNKT